LFNLANTLLVMIRGKVRCDGAKMGWYAESFQLSLLSGVLWRKFLYNRYLACSPFGDASSVHFWI